MSADWQFLVTLNGQLRTLKEPGEIQALAVRLLGEHLHASRATWTHADRHEFHGGGAMVDACRRGETVAVGDVRTDPRLTDGDRERFLAQATAAVVTAPLVKDGRWVSTMAVHSAAPLTWTSEQIALIEMTAEYTSAAAGRSAARDAQGPETRRAEAERWTNEQRLGFLLRLNDALRPLIDAGDVQLTAARLLGDYLGISRVGYADVDDRGYTIRYEHTQGGVAPLTGSDAGVTVGPELREALRRGETIAIADVETDSRLGDADRASLRSRQMAALIAAARFRNGRMIGAFGGNNTTPRAWTAHEIELVRDVAERTWDAVERSRAEAALVQQEQRFRLAIDASGGGSWTWVAATNQADWDERFRALYGFTADETPAADKWPSRVHEDDRPRVMALLDEIMTSPVKHSWQHTFRIVRPDGEVAWIQSRGRAERDAAGRLTRLTGLDLDFSQQRLVEEASLARQDEEHERTLRTLLETSTEGIVSVDEQGAIVTANHALHEMFGWAPGELIGQSVERLMPVPLRETHAKDRGRYFAAPHPRLMGGGLQLIGERKDGSTFPIEVRLNHVITSSGGRGFAFVTDITERQRAASALQAHAEELEYRTTQLSRMASDLTLAEQRARQQIASTLHDGLQQCLVIAALDLDQLLKRDDGGGPLSNELLQEVRLQIADAIEAARSLTLELFPPVMQHSGFAAALEWLANWIHDKYKIHVEVDADPRADTPRKEVRTLLFESVRELVFNAVKHAQADRVTVSLTLADDDQLCITVSDRGLGFDPATLDDRSQAGHVGWGLFSIRERLTLLGGRVEIESRPGEGTRVRLTAPGGAAAEIATERHTLSHAQDGPAFPGEDGRALDALRILIVDDHVAVRQGLRDMLHTRPQLSVVGDASNGFEAIARAHRLQPDVILMDVAMPHMDGLQATARIHAELPEIQILGFSMQAGSSIARALENAGAAAFFVKGLETRRLINYLLALHATRVGGDGASSS